MGLAQARKRPQGPFMNVVGTIIMIGFARLCLVLLCDFGEVSPGSKRGSRWGEGGGAIARLPPMRAHESVQRNRLITNP